MLEVRQAGPPQLDSHIRQHREFMRVYSVRPTIPWSHLRLAPPASSCRRCPLYWGSLQESNHLVGLPLLGRRLPWSARRSLDDGLSRLRDAADGVDDGPLPPPLPSPCSLDDHLRILLETRGETVAEDSEEGKESSFGKAA